MQRTDGELLRHAHEGDDDAFRLLIDRHKDVLVNYLANLTGSRDRGEEIAQETYLKLYRAATRYFEIDTARPLLFRIATNIARSDYRRTECWKRVAIRLIQPREAAHPDQQLLASEVQATVRDALSRLPVLYRGAVILRDIEEWSYEEIAKSLDCSVGTVKSRIARGREKLRDALADHYQGRAEHVRRTYA